MIAPFSRTVHFLFLLIVGLVLLGGAPARAQADAAAFIAGLADKAIPVLTNRQIPESQREQKFKELLDRGFDMSELSRLVLGRYWRQATPQEQKEFEALLESYLVQIYTDRFAEYQNVALDVGAARSDQGASFVSSTMRQQSGPLVQLEWRVERSGGRYIITDLVVEGVSMVITQRSEFASVIRQNGGQVSSLIDLLRQKTRH